MAGRKSEADHILLALTATLAQLFNSPAKRFEEFVMVFHAANCAVTRSEIPRADWLVPTRASRQATFLMAGHRLTPGHGLGMEPKRIDSVNVHWCNDLGADYVYRSTGRYRGSAIARQEFKYEKILALNHYDFFLRLGMRTRDLRRKHGHSQEDMILYGFSARHWQQIEAGRPITVVTLLRICAVFRMPVDRFVRGLDTGIYKE